jgi:hypothetical protein
MKLRPKGDWASFSLMWLPDLVAENLTDQGWQKSADRRGSYPQAQPPDLTVRVIAVAGRSVAGRSPRVAK